MSAEAALQKAVMAALKGNPDLTAIVGQRIYDRVPVGAARPYVAVRDYQTNDLPGDCTDSVEVFIGLDVWSESLTKVEASRAATEVNESLHEIALTLDPPYRLVDLRRQAHVISDDGEGLTRARMTFVALVDRV
ncbi:MAG TPA: DUF3168 domain-containing protein [Microvirga sp.]|jgi:hypothetical protein|nr:DUF3168 domain-containing protein [Microvirga sp.]